jgi:hypothetical protein
MGFSRASFGPLLMQSTNLPPPTLSCNGFLKARRQEYEYKISVERRALKPMINYISFHSTLMN